MENASPSNPSMHDGERLLRLARATVRRHLSERADRPAKNEAASGNTHGPDDRPIIAGQYGGAFVTFWAGRKLRGCVGSFAPTHDLATTIEEVTCSSLADPRFKNDPITASELDMLTIEISVVSDLQPTSDPLSLVPGVHGIMVCVGEQSGCFLPKVASEHDWSPEEFLAQCCAMKAGLPRNAWRSPNAQVSLFTTIVFAEDSPGRPPLRPPG